MSQIFEFTADQNRAFTGLYKWVKWCAVGFTVGFGVVGIYQIINLVVGGQSDWTWVIRSALMVAFGLLFLRPLDNIKSIVNTENSDMLHLMRCFSDMKWALYWGAIIFFAQAGIIASWMVRALLT